MSDEDEKPSDAKTPASEGGERMDLPTWNRAKSRRKANVKAEDREDSFQRGVKRVSAQALSRPVVVVGALVLGVGVVALVVWLRSSSQATLAVGTRALADAAAAENRGRIVENPAAFGLEPQDLENPPSPIFESEVARAEAVDAALSAVAEGEDDAALLGKLVRAGRAVRAGDHETATREYNAFLAEAPADHPLRFLAVEGSGIVLESSGDLEGALAVYESLAPEPGGFYRDQALVNRGRVLEALGRKDEATSLYKDYMAEFPIDKGGGMAAEAVRQRLLELDPDALAAAPQPEGLEILDGAAD